MKRISVIMAVLFLVATGSTWSIDVCPVRVVNVRDSGFTLVWATDQSTTGHLMFGTDAGNLDQVACDIRTPVPPCDLASSTHFVTIGGLSPSTTYYVQVVTGGVPTGPVRTIQTGTKLPPTVPFTAYGPVFLQDGVTPGTGSYVCTTLQDRDGLGSAGSSTDECDLLLPSSGGFWIANLGNARVAGLNASFSFSLSGDDVVQSACGGIDGCAEQRVDTGQVFPSAALILGDQCPGACRYYRDSDQDNYGDPDVSIACDDPEPPSGYSADGTDCDDLDPDVHPGAAERCNNVDDDCDTTVDDGADAACVDALFCNGQETCTEGACVLGAEVACDDGVACTTDSCNEAKDACAYVPNNTACDDGLFCNGAETCNATAGCQAGTTVACDDGVACTTDSCDEAKDACAHIPKNTACDDGLFCNGAETCNATTGCQAGTAVTCDDGVACTADSCVEAKDACAHLPNNVACDDGRFCNGTETCNATTGCQAGTAVACDDGLSCTADSCDEGRDACAYVPNNAACDDGVFCNGAETCNAETGCQAGTAVVCDDVVTCTADSCDEGKDACAYGPNNAACDDGVFCNGTETCNATTGCQAGTSVACDDGLACTADSCDEGKDTCAHVPNHAACDDGLYCNGTETCNATTGCQAGTAIACDDGVTCTADSCDEGKDACAHVPNNAACDDGLYCNGSEVCNATTGCQAGTAVVCDDGVACTSDSCVEASDACTNVPNNAACDDGLYCNGTEFCNATTGCQAGTAVACDDGIACTADSCVEASDACTNATNNAACDDGLYCNGAEVCNATTGCQAGTAVACDDGVACTADSCVEASDACANVPNDTACDDGAFCNGRETCDPTVGCRAGTSVACDDGVTCTTDSCDEGVDACVHLPSNAACDDGDRCTDDVCTPAGCVHTPNPTCTCGPDGAPCNDGNACTTNDSCTNGTCLGGTATNCDDGNICTNDSCEPAAGCAHAPNAVACSDGNACTTGDTCAGGTCHGGLPTVCVASDQCHVAGVCNPGTGACSDPASANGTTCDDGNAGTTGDSCQNGLCVGGGSSCGIEPRPKRHGYYKALCKDGHGRPHHGDALTSSDAACVGAMTQTFAGISTVEDLCVVLEGQHGNGSGYDSNQCYKAEQELMTTALNLCRQLVCPDQELHSGCSGSGHDSDTGHDSDHVGHDSDHQTGTTSGHPNDVVTTVAASLASADLILSDPTRDKNVCKTAQCLTKEINNGQALRHTALRLDKENGNGVRLRWSSAGSDDGSGDASFYTIWRRALNSPGEYVRIATTTELTFVDPQPGEWEYDVTYTAEP